MAVRADTVAAHEAAIAVVLVAATVAVHVAAALAVAAVTLAASAVAAAMVAAGIDKQLRFSSKRLVCFGRRAFLTRMQMLDEPFCNASSPPSQHLIFHDPWS